MTPFERAKKVVISQGKSVVILETMSTEEVVEVASMCGSDGEMVPGVGLLFGDWLRGRGCGCQDEVEAGDE